MAKTIKCRFCGSPDRTDFTCSRMCDACVYQHVEAVIDGQGLVGRLLVRRNLRRLERQGSRRVILCRWCGGGAVPPLPWQYVSCARCMEEHAEGVLLGMSRWSARVVSRRFGRWWRAY
jgi:hypothetical protein